MSFDIKYYKIVSQYDKVVIAQYLDNTNTEANLLATGFFNDLANQLSKGSIILANTTTGTIILSVTGVTSGVVTVAKLLPKAVTPPEQNSVQTVAAYSAQAPASTTLTSTIQAGDIGGSIICTFENDTFINQEAVINTNNWIIVTGNTGLLLEEVVYVDTYTARLVFSGTAAAGAINIAPVATILINNTAFVAGEYEIE